MRVVFRADASYQIGVGHIMRCITLADMLRLSGVECHFVCREHVGHLIEYVRNRGYVVHNLPVCHSGNGELEHSDWLGVDQDQDALDCRLIFATLRPDWIIVDHYALDIQWEKMVTTYSRNLMVIDDLKDREHFCQLLLDQSLGRVAVDYQTLVPHDCRLLCGSNYVLLRPEFIASREYSLQRRFEPELKRLLITMGGVDEANVTSKVLAILKDCELPAGFEINVVMGGTSPWLREIKRLAQEMPWATKVLIGVSNMAEIMADSDLAIGAAGCTAWERCVLGLPSIVVVLADNQKYAANVLNQAGAALIAEDLAQIKKMLTNFLDFRVRSDIFKKMSDVSSNLIDGLGSFRVSECLLSFDKS